MDSRHILSGGILANLVLASTHASPGRPRKKR